MNFGRVRMYEMFFLLAKPAPTIIRIDGEAGFHHDGTPKLATVNLTAQQQLDGFRVFSYAPR